jgi:hypothetical protein
MKATATGSAAVDLGFSPQALIVIAKIKINKYVLTIVSF